MLSRSVLLIAVVSLTAGAALAAPAGAAVLGPGDGVTATRNGTRLDVTFTPAALTAAKVKAGSSVDLSCFRWAPPALALSEQDSERDLTDANGTIGADGVAHLTLAGDLDEKTPGTLDYCEIHREDLIGRNASVVMIARVSLTPTGVTLVDETQRAVNLRHLLIKARAAPGYQPVAAHDGAAVAMDSPDATPPAGQVGYWTDGTRASVATLSAAGRRLVIEDRGGLVVRTNVLEEMDVYGEEDPLPAGAADARPTKDAKEPDDDRSPSPFAREVALTPREGLRASRSGRKLTLHFTGAAAATFRRLAGRHVAVACLPASPPSLLPNLLGAFTTTTDPKTSSHGIARVARRGGEATVPLRGNAKAADVCLVTDDDTAIGVVTASPAGARWLQDYRALESFSTDDLKFAAPGGRTYRTTAQLVAEKPGRYVAMSGPDAPVPVGKVGIWSDGAHQAALAVRSATGRRFVVADEGDRMGRTNVLGQVSGLFITVSLLLDDTTSGND
jgi:hypothetical protein